MVGPPFRLEPQSEVEGGVGHPINGDARRQTRGRGSLASDLCGVAQNQKNRRSAIDGRTTRHPGYAISQCIRKRIEEPFGWMKAAGGFRQTKHRGGERVGCMFTIRAAAYNLIRLPNLLATT